MPLTETIGPSAFLVLLGFSSQCYHNFMEPWKVILFFLVTNTFHFTIRSEFLFIIVSLAAIEKNFILISLYIYLFLL